MIPIFRPSCTDLEIRYVTEVLRSGWWTTGPKTEELETAFAVYTGSGYAVAVSSCTAALQLALQVAGAEGGEVIMPALTFAATGLAALHAGAQVVLADISESTLCIDWTDAERKITADTRAIVPVWYGGLVSPFIPSLDTHFIEDCAHAAGNPLAGKSGVTACWSFNAVKNLASGEGGMITTNDRKIAERLRRLRWFGIDKDTYSRGRSGQYNWEYDIPEAGLKANMSDILAAIALAQLERLDEMNSRRRKIVKVYLDQLKDLDWLRLPEWREVSSWHMFTVRTECRDEFIDHLNSRDVSAGVHYKPLNHYEIFGRQDLPVTDKIWKTLVTLPLYPDMTEAEVGQVTEAVRSFR